MPFLFTIKELEAKGTLDGFGGDFMVPSYRGSSFLDPKVPLPTSFRLWNRGAFSLPESSGHSRSRRHTEAPGSERFGKHL